MPQLVIYEQGSSPTTAATIWPASGALPAGLVQEARIYILELRDSSDPLSVELYLDDELLEALRPPDATTARWRWSPGFYAGAVTVRLEVAGRPPQTFQAVIDPDLQKLTRAEFDHMVEEILGDTFHLLALSSVRTGIARGTAGDLPPLARLEFIRSRLESLDRAVREIDRRPIRILRSEIVPTPYHKAGGATGKEILRSLRSGRVVKEGSDSNRLPDGFHGLFPVRVLKTVKSTGVDIREHRDIKAALTRWSSWLRAVADRLAGSAAEDEELRRAQRIWSQRCRALVRKLEALLQLPVFADVSDQTAQVVSTAVYRRVAPYRSFFCIHRDMQLGIANILGDFLQVPLARTYDLYELWCFLRLVRAAAILFPGAGIDTSSLFDRRSKSGSVVLSKERIVVSLGNGYSLAFQRTYREYWVEPDKRGSFSRSMVPDVSITLPTSGDGLSRLTILDAKYRINRHLNEAIASIHMYRDALVEPAGDGSVREIVVAAYLMSPHLAHYAAHWQASDMPGRLFHPTYRSSFKFGAVTLRPGMSLQQVTSTLETILADAGAAAPVPVGSI